MNANKVILLDAGHGGLDDNGHYVTPGKRSPVWSDGSQYFEGVGNRLIVSNIEEYLLDEGITYHKVTTGYKDVSLKQRVDIINGYCEMYGKNNCLLVSIHSNAFSKPSACGWSVYTTKGITASDVWANRLYNYMQAMFPNEKFRSDFSDGDADWEEQFYIIRKSLCPAVLSENFFHTNEDECRNILMTNEGRWKIAKAHFQMIKDFVNEN